MITFRDYALGLAPVWLRGEWGDRYVQTLALIFDMLAEQALIAGEMSLLDSRLPNDDALERIGRGRSMRRYMGESAEVYRNRLRAAWDAWRQAGTKQGIKVQLQAVGYEATLFQNSDWNWDNNAANWSRFWVVVTGHPFGRWYIGDGHKLDPNLTIGLIGTLNEVRALRALVREWKPAHVVCTFIVIVFDLDEWEDGQPDGTWGKPGTRNRAAFYISG